MKFFESLLKIGIKLIIGVVLFNLMFRYYNDTYAIAPSPNQSLINGGIATFIGLIKTFTTKLLILALLLILIEVMVAICKKATPIKDKEQS